MKMKRGAWGVEGMGKGLAVIFLYALLSTPVLAVEVQPVINAELLAGQYWYNGADSKLGGIAALSAAPFLKFNDRWSVVPLYEGRYQGIAQVTDFTGGGTRFNDSQAHNLSAKTIYTLSPRWKLKAIGAYGADLLRETEDEDWTEGLYDNRRVSGGTEAEYGWAENQFVRAAYDYYAVTFPNYQSLESGQVDNGLGRELAEPDVLDNQNHRLLLHGQTGIIGQGILELSASHIWRGFGQQHVVAASGDLTEETRTDRILGTSLMGTWPVATFGRSHLLTGLGYTWTHLASNQNSYDASKTTFRPNFYANTTHAFTNRWTLLIGEENPSTVSFSALFSRQHYADRLTQDSVGTYGTDTTDVDNLILGLTGSYPIAKNFQLRGMVSLGWSDSNNTYTKVYEYHYNTQSYLLGFSYAY